MRGQRSSGNLKKSSGAAKQMWGEKECGECDMCGFIVSLTGSVPFEAFVERRGPDNSGIYSRDGFVFRHYLLHITGAVLAQPIVEGDLVCLFNGEIYSHPYALSDAECILPLYKEHGIHFARFLDGEYAIAIYDFARGKIVFATDPFATKPLWRSGSLCASYRSAVGGRPVPPNTTEVCDFDGKVVTSIENKQFIFSAQHKSSYDDWMRAFENAILKRARQDCYIGLSSGYDSGAIACELGKIGCSFTAYSFAGQEHLATLLKRHELVSGKFIQAEEVSYHQESVFLRSTCEAYDYRQDACVPLRVSNMHEDPGAVGASMIHRLARSEGRTVFLSGQGADEILSDYGKSPSISHFRGVFPASLSKWPNFDGGVQKAYLAKEEYVAGAHGVEGRYPFLDFDLVQEFLWLTPALKNMAYKAPLWKYLSDNKYPMWENKKAGFRVFAD